ncbi:MAG: chemotaxis protein CheC [Candidatus Omnitrophica bacterium]|nr:chemotaxis protein CheC [Candidatus Omnitrophota bacterium]
MEKKLNLSTEQLDALKEIGNIGAGNSATALSQLLGRKVNINVPQVRLLQLGKLSEISIMGKVSGISIAISLKILGKLKGGMLVLFPQKSALSMIDILTKRKIGSTEVFNLEDESALSESSHIICCSYLNAVGQFLNLYQLIPSISATSIDRIDKLAKVMIKRFIKDDASYILPIENRMLIEGTELDLLVIFLLEVESLNKILKTVGL